MIKCGLKAQPAPFKDFMASNMLNQVANMHLANLKKKMSVQPNGQSNDPRDEARQELDQEQAQNGGVNPSPEIAQAVNPKADPMKKMKKGK